MNIKRLLVIPFLLWSHTGRPYVLEGSKGLIEIFIDGLSFGIDGKMFGLMLKIRKQLKETISGNKEGVGKFNLNSITRTLKELADLEQHYLETNNHHSLKELQLVLASVVQDLNTHLTKYAELAKGVKQYLLIFINESCLKHGRKSSILQHWAQIKEGREAQQLKKDLVDLKSALQFCWDMIYFLEDMCDSCPKAQKQFRVLLEKAQR